MPTPPYQTVQRPYQATATFQEQNKKGDKQTGSKAQAGAKPARKSGPGGLAARIVGPVAIEPGHAPFHALAEAGKAAVLDDRVVHGVLRAIVQQHVGAAEAARNVVGLPGPERGFMDLAIGGDLHGRISELPFFSLALGAEGPQHPLAFGHPATIARPRPPQV